MQKPPVAGSMSSRRASSRPAATLSANVAMQQPRIGSRCQTIPASVDGRTYDPTVTPMAPWLSRTRSGFGLAVVEPDRASPTPASRPPNNVGVGGCPRASRPDSPSVRVTRVSARSSSLARRPFLECGMGRPFAGAPSWALLSWVSRRSPWWRTRWCTSLRCPRSCPSSRGRTSARCYRRFARR